jgi:hypothetical protein
VLLEDDYRCLDLLCIHTVNAAFPDVGEHLLVAVFGANVALSRKQFLNVILSRVEDRREFGGHG